MVSKQFREFARDPATQGVVIDDKDCMAGIPSFLTSKDKHVLVNTLQGLKFLSVSPLYQEKVAGMDQLVTLLLFLQREKEVEAPAISGLCTSILEDLNPYLDTGSLEPGEISVALPSSHQGEYTERKKKHRHRKSLGSGKKRKKRKVHTLVLVVDGHFMLSGEAVNRITIACLQVKGVLSATITMNQVILTSTRRESSIIEPLIAAIAGCGFRANSLKNALEKQKLKQDENNSNSSAPKSTVPLPSYLTINPKIKSKGRVPTRQPLNPLPSYFDDENPAEFDDDDDDGYFGSVEGVPQKAAIVKHQGVMESSLEAQFVKKRQTARLEAQKKEELGFVSSFLGALGFGV